MQEIRVSNDASQEFRTVLDGYRLRIRFEWIASANSWFISLLDINRNIISASATVKTGIPVFNSVLIPELPGDIVAAPLTNPIQEPGRQAWGTTHRLYFGTTEELEDLNVPLF